MIVIWWIWAVAWVVWAGLLIWTGVRRYDRAFSAIAIVGLILLSSVAIVGSVQNWPVPQ